MTGLRQGPTVQHDSKAGTLRLSGLFATLQDPTLVNKAFDAFGWHKDTNVYADNFEMKVKYSRVRHQNADFAFLVKPLPCESTTYAHFCGSFVVATA